MRKLFVLLLAVAGCGPATGHPTGSSDGGTPTLTSIDVAPATVSLVTGQGGAAAQQFTATAHYADGRSEDVTATMGWSISDPGMGSVLNGTFAGATTRGGVATISAGNAAIQGSATISIKYVAQRASSADGSTAPASSGTFFTNATEDATLAPTLAYPLDGARVPHNLGLLEVQWKKSASTTDLFEVSFQSPTVDYKVYTNALLTAGGRLSLTPDEWQSLADSNAGSTVAVTVRGTNSTTPGKIGTSATVQLDVGTADVSGGIYYFAPVSATGAQIGAIVRHQFGDTSGQATQFYAPNNGTRCVGCHVITHDGTKLAATFDGGNGPAIEVGVPSLNTVLAEASGIKWNFASYSPDGNRMVASSGGNLKIYDTAGGATNGAVQQTLADGSATNYASHPDWSLDGSKIVYVSVGGPENNTEWSFTKGSIVVVSDNGMGVFGAPKTIVQSAGENNYYPSFSPDGKWILFNRGSGHAYSDPGAEVWVVSSDGKIGPIALAKSNAAGALTNSWPRWNPFVVHEPGGDLMFFTLSSTRDYGIELVAVTPVQPQVWMAAFDPAKAAAGMDPSSVAFWMPFQDLKSHNHIAQWTATYIP